MARTHPALEIPIRGGNADLALFQQANTQANARSAAGRQCVGACIKQRLPNPALFGFLLHPGAGRTEVELHS